MNGKKINLDSLFFTQKGTPCFFSSGVTLEYQMSACSSRIGYPERLNGILYRYVHSKFYLRGNCNTLVAIKDTRQVLFVNEKITMSIYTMTLFVR